MKYEVVMTPRLEPWIMRAPRWETANFRAAFIKQPGSFVSIWHCPLISFVHETNRFFFPSQQARHANTTASAWTLRAPTSVAAWRASPGRGARPTSMSANPSPARTRGHASMTPAPSAASACLVSTTLTLALQICSNQLKLPRSHSPSTLICRQTADYSFCAKEFHLTFDLAGSELLQAKGQTWTSPRAS